MAVGWRPYTQGHWVDTDYGWTWISDEPWGWATYHYGRWLADQEYGWLWVPGNQWGPAWVSFQQGGGYVGWAPLPPAVGFQAGIGLQHRRVQPERSASIPTPTPSCRSAISSTSGWRPSSCRRPAT